MTASGRQLLAEWANTQDGWVRTIVGEVLVTRAPLATPTVEAAYGMMLAEKQLTTDPAPTVADLAAADTTEEPVDDLRLMRIGDVAGVNALAANQDIALNRRMTLLFGENGAGKTGYVRILKRIASVRSAEPILANVRAAGSPARPTARLEYRLNEVATTTSWNDEAGVPPFTRISVFDSRAVSIHVDDDLAYVVTPGDVALFQHVHHALEDVRERLEQDRSARTVKSNRFVALFQRDGTLYAKIEALGASTDLAELERLARLTGDDERRLAQLQESIGALQANTTQVRLQVADSDRRLYVSLASVVRAIADFDLAGYEGSVSRMRAAEERFEAASQASFADDGIPGALQDSWRAFVNAGEAYTRDIEDPHYPQDGAACLYCRQDLGAAAIALLRKYRQYADGEPRRALDAARQDYQARISPLHALEIAALRTSVANRIATYQNPTQVPPSLSGAAQLLDAVDVVRSEIQQARIPSLPVHTLASALGVALATDSVRLDDTIQTMNAQASERAKALAAAQEEHRLLANRFQLRAVLEEVRQYVARAKWADRATAVLGRFQGLLRQVTELSKLVSEELLNRDFERHFRIECERLRAPPVKLDFTGRKGQATRRKVLAETHRLSQVLSEGEQTVIALADFLAEVALKPASAPVVFDDPVSSLDYKRLDYVIARIVELSASRQVVIFTHNIWFAVALLGAFEKGNECSFYHVGSDGTPGSVAPGTGPRWDTPKSIAATINTLIQGAGKESGEVQAALVERGYDHLRSWCEVFVEQELLGSVSQRYQPNIMMTRLPQVRADRFVAARDAVLPLFEKACRVMTGHSQPLETLSVRPTLAELREDWAKAQEARAAYIK